MALDYNNPNDWGKSPLTDNALRIQQFRAENPEQWEAMIEDDLNSLAVGGEPIITDPCDAFTTIDDTPNPLSHGQFLGNFSGEIDPDTIWRLGEGDRTALDEISNPATQERAKNIFNRIDDLGYWDDQLFGDEPT